MHPDHISPNGIELIKRFEGLHRVQEDGMVSSYRCPAGRWTIGYGSTKGVRSGVRLTKEECELRLKADLREFEIAVKRNVLVPLSQFQFDALVSWTFNLGEGNLKSSTLLKKLNKGEYQAIPAEMIKWNKARVDGNLTVLPGLTRRRTAEAALWALDAKLPTDDGGSEMPQRVVADAPKKLTKSKTMAGAGIAGAATMMNELSGQVQGLVPYADSLKTIFLFLALGGIALAAYARWKDHKEGVH